MALTESRSRAGDIVKKGQVLGALDASELALERRKSLALREHARELRAAMAAHDGSPRCAQVDRPRPGRASGGS
jgi:multidrug efflux pump subunit AcrA (membrane-fusion protein)